MIEPRDPKIVFFDLETIPNLTEVLKVYPKMGDYPGLTLKATITSILCAGYKVFGEKQVKCINAWDFPSWRRDINDDKAVVTALYEVLKDADAVVTHNGRRFDWKFLQTRLLKHGVAPLPNIHHIDTCALAKSHLYLFNNRLTTLAQFLTDDDKLDNGGWDLWVRAHAREKKALAEMEAYCKHDVVVLEKVFRHLRPFAKLPNHNLFSIGKENLCPNCGSTRIKSNGWRHTQVRSYRRYKCIDCHTVSRTNAEDKLPRAL